MYPSHHPPAQPVGMVEAAELRNGVLWVLAPLPPEVRRDLPPQVTLPLGVVNQMMRDIDEERKVRPSRQSAVEVTTNRANLDEMD